MCQEMIVLELVLDSGLSYDEYFSQPDWFLEAHEIRFFAKQKALAK